MTRRRKPSPPDIKEEIATSSYETPPVKKKKKAKKDDVIDDLTNDDEFVDSSKDLKLSDLDIKPAEKIQHPYSSISEKPKPKPEFIRPESRLPPTISKPSARGSVASSTTSKTSSDSYESYTYGKKRGRGFILAEEDSEEESSASDEEK